jgi:hypothetical protein
MFGKGIIHGMVCSPFLPNIPLPVIPLPSRPPQKVKQGVLELQANTPQRG